MRIDLYRLADGDRMGLVRVLEANGCRDWVAYEALRLDGKVVTYEALCRKGREHDIRFENGEAVTRAKRLRLRSGADVVRGVAGRQVVRPGDGG